MATTTTTTTVAHTSAPPSQSLYIQNLPEKLQKNDLKRALYMLFSAYGPILDVTALKTPKMRGQAHVLFRDTHAATQALRGCQGFDMFGREMRISYAKNRSDTLAKLTGTFNQPEPAKAQAQAPSTAFPAPPGVGAPNGLPPPPGLLPAKVGEIQAAEANAPSPQGVKRPREEDDDGEEAPMEEDDDEGAMEMSDEED